MKKIPILIITILFLNFHQGLSQRTCGTQDLFEESLKENPGLGSFVERYSDYINRLIRDYPFNPQLHRSPVTIPVVVHILYKNNFENITDSQVFSQIEALNRDFRKCNLSEIQMAPDEFRNLATDTYIQFKLAERDPKGNTTNGITRAITNKGYFLCHIDEVKKPTTGGVAAWDTDRYLNIWVCDIKDLNSGGIISNEILGYATFPEDTTVTQGVVIDYLYFGTEGTATSPFNLGRTTTHEVGHFFGLRHIWGDANCGDDFVDDTPTQQTSNTTCPSHPHPSCGSNDMFMNYMDYVDDNCMYMFTNGQRARMLANLSPGAARSSLAVSDALFPTNSSNLEYLVFLEPQKYGMPSWKAALYMITNWAWQQTLDIDKVIQDNAVYCNKNRFVEISNEISDVICALALTPEEITYCISMDFFYRIIEKGPIALLSSSSNEYYGLVINGMMMDKVTEKALLKIKDPQEIGPQFGFNQKGSEYLVDFGEFMNDILEKLTTENTHVYIIYPPSRGS